MSRIRTGTIYSEITTDSHRKGRGCGALTNVGFGKIYSKFRWVAEIRYHGKRYRFRSTNYNNVRLWLDDMCRKFN